MFLRYRRTLTKTTPILGRVFSTTNTGPATAAARPICNTPSRELSEVHEITLKMAQILIKQCEEDQKSRSSAQVDISKARWEGMFYCMLAFGFVGWAFGVDQLLKERLKEK